LVIEVNDYGQPKLPAKANQVYGKPGKGDNTGWYINPRDGSVQSVAYRLPEKKTTTVKGEDGRQAIVEEVDVPKPRPDVTQKGLDMIGDLRTDALHEALARAPIEDETLLALMILGFAGTNVTIASGASDNPYAHANGRKHAARLIGEDGRLSFDRAILQQVARSLLIDVMSCRRNRSDSGIAARIAGNAIGADQFLVNTATEEFLSCLSRSALEAAAGEAGVETGAKVKETRAALVAHFAEDRFVHPAALIAPDDREVAAFAAAYATAEPPASEHDANSSDDHPVAPEDGDPEDIDEAADTEEVESDFREAAE